MSSNELSTNKTITNNKKRTILFDDDSSQSSDLTRTPPHSNTPLFFSPRFNTSPPNNGSGGKYMIKSKRTSWLMDSKLRENLSDEDVHYQHLRHSSISSFISDNLSLQSDENEGKKKLLYRLFLTNC